MSFELISPIPNNDAYDETFIENAKYPRIPHYGGAGAVSDNWLDLLSCLTTLSPSMGAIKSDFRKYCFEAGIDVVRKSIAGFKPSSTSDSDTEEEITYETKKEFILKLKELGITPMMISNLSGCLENDSTDFGNYYLRVRLIHELGSWRAEFKVISNKHISRLKKTRKDHPMTYIHSKIKDENHKDFKPDILLGNYAFSDLVWDEYEIKVTNTKVFETVIHFKTKTDESDYYGRPTILSILDWLNSEINYGVLTNKISNTETITKTILAFQQPNPAKNRGGRDSRKSKFKKVMKTLQEVITNQGDRGVAKSIVGIEYPFSGTPPTSIPLEVNRDSDYQKAMLECAKNYIYANNSWSPLLTGQEAAKSGIGTNTLLNAAIYFNSKTIRPKQQHYSNFWNWLICEILEVTHGDSETDLGIKFNSLMDGMIRDLREIDSKTPVE